MKHFGDETFPTIGLYFAICIPTSQVLMSL